jgi:transposase-like protein
MKTATHTEARFHNEEVARAHLEATRWPKGPVCPHCGGVERNSRLEGKAHRPGLLFCGDCRAQFSVTVGTVFEDSKLPLHKWVYAIHLLCSSKKGMSSKQLERMLKVTYKTAWFMSHRIRAAMASEPTGQLGGSGKIVEVDETYYGNKKGAKPIPGGAHKHRIVSLVERKGNPIIAGRTRVLTPLGGFRPSTIGTSIARFLYRPCKWPLPNIDLLSLMAESPVFLDKLSTG